MHLKPEAEAIGRENFYAAIGHNIRNGKTRELGPRGLLQERIAMQNETGEVPGGEYFGYDQADIDANGGPVRIGVIGTGDEGSVLIGALKPEFVSVRAIADIRPYNQYRAFHGDVFGSTARAVRPGLIKVYGYDRDPVTRRGRSPEDAEAAAKADIKVYDTWQKLIANAQADGIEAVIIALPLHLHAPAAIAAMRAGLHVLTEKLMGHSIAQCKAMSRVAKETHKHLATGHQRHYSVLYDRCVELIRSGVLGDLHFIRAQWHRSNKPGNDSWQQPLPTGAKPEDALAGTIEALLEMEKEKKHQLELDLKKPENDDPNKQASIKRAIAECERQIRQRDAQLADEKLTEPGPGGKPRVEEEYGYQYRKEDGYERPAIEELIRWRLWERTGGGLMAELGSHQLDASSIFIAAVHGEKQKPLAVSAASNRVLFHADRDCDDHVTCLYEFPALKYKADDPLLSLRKIGVQYSSINGNGYGGYGEEVLGEVGTLLIQRETEAMLFKTSDTASKTKVVWSSGMASLTLATDDNGDRASAVVGEKAVHGTGRGYQQQIEHWAWCIRVNPDVSDEKKQPRCKPKVAMGDAVIALTSNRAAEEGIRIEFDPDWFEVDKDATGEYATDDQGNQVPVTPQDALKEMEDTYQI